MKPLMFTLAAVAVLCVSTSSASAQYNTSYSWNQSYTSSYGNSWSYGPNGYHSRGYRNNTAMTTYSRNYSGIDPRTGIRYSGSRSSSTGWNSYSGYNRGIYANGGYSNNYAGYRRFSAQASSIRYG